MKRRVRQGVALAWVAAASALALACADAPAPTLLLVSVDTLRADHLGAYGSARGLTPRLDALAAESQLFERAYAPAPFTRPSAASLLTGREPARIGMLSNRSLLPEDVPTLVRTFVEHGWACGAVVSNPVLGRGGGLERHFRHFDDAGDGSRDAAATTDAALGALDALGEAPGAGRFLWVHYQDPHGPYTPPAGQRARQLAAEAQRPDARRVLPVSPGDSGRGGIPAYQVLGDAREVGFYRAGYAGEVAHVDAEIGRLLDGVAARGLLERALVVFTADHGEALGEGDLWFAHGESLHDALVRVPLLLRVPGRPGARRDDVAGLVDVAATVAQHFGLPVPEASGGRDLLAPGAGAASSRVFLSTLAYVNPPEFGMVDQQFRYVIAMPEGEAAERLIASGGEGPDLKAENPDALERLRRATRERVRELRAARGEQRQALDAETRAQLRALGYADD